MGTILEKGFAQALVHASQHLCLCKILSQNCPHGEIRQSLFQHFRTNFILPWFNVQCYCNVQLKHALVCRTRWFVKCIRRNTSSKYYRRRSKRKTRLRHNVAKAVLKSQSFFCNFLQYSPETMKELLSLCPEKLHCPVPLETLVFTNP